MNASRLRILSVGNIYPPHDMGGGYELTWRSSAADLRERGHAVRVLTTDFRVDAPSGEEDPDVHRELRWYWHDHGFPRRGWRERVALERHNASVLELHLREFAPQVVNWWGMGGVSLGLIERVRRSGLPAVGVVGDEWMVWGPRADAWSRPFRRRPRLARHAERITGLPARPRLGEAALWLFNSEHVREKTLAAGWSLPRSAVLHPGIDESLFRPAPPRPWEWRLLYIGRLDPRKGVKLAIEALALLPDQAELTLQGGGDPAYVEELRTHAGSLGVGERVLFAAQPRERIADLYAEADVVVFPVQWEEPWGLVPLEAMAVGRPVVATGTGGSAEYLRDGENCLIFRPRHSPDALAAAVRRLASDEPLRARLRTGGAETAAPFTERRYNERIARTIEVEAE